MVRSSGLIDAVLVGIGVSSSAFAGGRPDLVLAGLKAGRAYQPGELIVKFRDGTSDAQQRVVIEGLGAQKADRSAPATRRGARRRCRACHGRLGRLRRAGAAR